MPVRDHRRLGQVVELRWHKGFLGGLALLHSAHLDLVLDVSERFALTQLHWHMFHVELVSLAFVKHGWQGQAVLLVA